MNNRRQVVRVNGIPVGWAFGEFEGAKTIIDEMLIHDGHTSGSINFGITSRDLNFYEPREPGFYRYSSGSRVMIFLLKDNRERLKFFKGALDDPENEWQWYVILDNGSMDRCEWGYIEQALGVEELVKIP